MGLARGGKGTFPSRASSRGASISGRCVSRRARYRRAVVPDTGPGRVVGKRPVSCKRRMRYRGSAWPLVMGIVLGLSVIAQGNLDVWYKECGIDNAAPA